MDEQEIRERIASFPVWHYRFELAGVPTPIRDPRMVVRHAERKRYFFDPVVELCGGSLRGKRVLDLGCNAGFWSLQAAEAGADFVLGVDGREQNVEQARFVFEAKGIGAERHRFLAGNVYDVDYAAHGEFDVVLNLGLLYHLAKPMALLERVAAVNTDLHVIDTGILPLPGPFLQYGREDRDDPANATESELVSRPTKETLRDMLATLGYRSVVLRPGFRDWTGSPQYRRGFRRAFLGAKRSDLGALRAPTEPFEAPVSGLLAPLWWLYRGARAARFALGRAGSGKSRVPLD